MCAMGYEDQRIAVHFLAKRNIRNIRNIRSQGVAGVLRKRRGCASLKLPAHKKIRRPQYSTDSERTIRRESIQTSVKPLVIRVPLPGSRCLPERQRGHLRRRHEFVPFA